MSDPIQQQAQEALPVIAKVGSVWAVFGITSWAEASYAIAFFYTAVLLIHFLWKHVLKPFCGWWRKR
jgi:hypothetical protein